MKWLVALPILVLASRWPLFVALTPLSGDPRKLVSPSPCRGFKTTGATPGPVISSGEARISAAMTDAEDLTYQRLLSIIAPGQGSGPAGPENIDQLLERLPIQFRSNFNLVHTTGSPHQDDESVDPLHPRIILFSQDARLLLAFTGNPERPGYNIVEAITFIDQEARFQFTRFVLPAALERDPSLAELAAHNGQSDTSCNRCHGQDPRPLDESYPTWPGFYGSLHDQFVEGTTEHRNYVEFLAHKNAPGLPYKYLGFGDNSALPPFLDTSMKLEGTEQLPMMPNTRMGMALTQLNRKRIQRKLRESPAYDHYKYALLASLIECDPAPYDENHVEQIRSQLEREQRFKLARLGIDPDSKLAQRFPLQELFPKVLRNATHVDFMARALGVSRAEWSLAPEPGSLQLFDGVLSGAVRDGNRGKSNYYLKEDFIIEMLLDMEATDPDLRSFLRLTAPYPGYPFPTKARLVGLHKNAKLCAMLKDRIAAVQGGLPAIQSRPVNEMQGPGAKCVRCHLPSEPDYSGIRIPFDEPKELAKLLTAKCLSGKRTLGDEILLRIQPGAKYPMPMNGSLEPAEVALLEKYVRSLTDGSF